MSAPPIISAVICTHNRAAYLRKALHSLAEQSLPRDQYEVLVVDNASTDDTPAVCAEFPGVRRIVEPRLGLNRARNTGWREVRGEYVAYLDDDAVACRDWLERIVHAFESVQPTPGCVGGSALPRWEAERPPWLHEGLLISLALLDWSDRPVSFVPEGRRILVGANMAFQRSVLKEMGGFHPRLDRTGTRNLLSGGELLMEIRLAAGGRLCHFDPSIRVEHHVPAERLRKAWFRRRYYWQGVSEAYLEFLRAPLSWRARAARLRDALRFLARREAVRELLSRADEPDAFRRQCMALVRLGHLVGYTRLLFASVAAWHGPAATR